MDKKFFDILKYNLLYFISPHLDDVIFSCGALIYELKKKKNIQIINIFTDFGNKISSKEGLFFLKKTNFNSFLELYKTRLIEDKKIFSQLKMNVFYLNFKEFIFQKSKNLKHYLNNKNLKKNIFIKTKNIIKDENGIVFIPFGIGNFDHILIRNIFENKFNNIIYYLEWPYLLNKYSTIRNLKIKNNYHIFEFKKNLFIKEDLVKYYRSQIKIIFEDRSILLLKERYLIKKD